MLIFILAIQYIVCVDVLGILLCSCSAVTAYTSLASAIVIIASIFIVRSNATFNTILGVVLLSYAMDTTTSSAATALIICIASILISIQLLSATHLTAIYVMLSTLTTLIFWVGLMAGYSHIDLLPSYVLASTLLVVMVWTVSAIPRLGFMMLVLLQLIVKTYLFVGMLTLYPSNSLIDLACILSSLSLTCAMLLTPTDVRTMCIVLSTVWVIQLAVMSSTAGMSVSVLVYLGFYILLSMVLLMLLSSARS